MLGIEIEKLRRLEDQIRDIEASTLYRILLVEAIDAVELAKNISDLDQFEKGLLELFTECVNSQLGELMMQWYKRMEYINTLKDKEVKRAYFIFEQRMINHFFPWCRRDVPSDEMIVEAKKLYSDLITEQALEEELKSTISSSADCFINSEKIDHQTMINQNPIMKECFKKEISLIEKFHTKWKEYGRASLYNDLK